MQDITKLSLEELEDKLKGSGAKGYHAGQIFSWIYNKATLDFAEMSDLPKDLREKLKEKFIITGLKVAKLRESSDGTKKILFRLLDANFIEAVIIPSKERVTGCVSTQVGCKFACRFCASGQGGFKRDLTFAEIIGEVLYLKKEALPGKLTHLVFMGTGEPLDNYAEVMKAVRIINSPSAFNIGARRITISTSGIIPGIQKLSGEGLQIELSVSLHTADDKLRSELMPVNKIYPLKELINTCKKYSLDTNRQVTLEYILIKGVNSELQHAQDLRKLLSGFPLAKINLIPSNVIKELNIEPPGRPEVLLFKEYLVKNGLNVTLRRERGGDIEAACGQLRLKYAEK